MCDTCGCQKKLETEPVKEETISKVSVKKD